MKNSTKPIGEVVAAATRGALRWNKQRSHKGDAWQWILESDTRASMAIMEVWDLSSWAKRPENRGADNIAEHAETMNEVDANAALIAHYWNTYADLLRVAINLLIVADALKGHSLSAQTVVDDARYVLERACAVEVVEEDTYDQE